jgi:Family 4 glycosyl hydrolase/Family 4 glycosyl hydrolase C-terminal domain
MERVCPDAWLLNLTNPMTALCRAVTKATSIKTVGLCHEVTNFRGVLTLLADAAWDAIDLSITGVNHVPVVTTIDLGDGRDGMAFLRDVLDEKVDLDADLGFDLGPDEHERPGSFGAERLPRRATRRALVEEYAAGFELFRRFGAFVAPGNRHTLEAFPSLLAEDADWGERWRVHYTTIEERERHEARYADDLDRRLADDRPPQYPSLGAGGHGRGRAHRRPRARARGDAARSPRGNPRPRDHRADDRRAPRRDAALAAPVLSCSKRRRRSRPCR